MILAVDPGGTTGVAYQFSDGQVLFEQIPGGDLAFGNWFHHFVIQEGAPRFVKTFEIVCESFIPRPGARSMQYDALYIIGMLRDWCSRHGVTLKLQSPAQAKSFATNEKLKAAGLYPVGQGHAQDAARHLLVHLVTADPQGIVAKRVADGLGL